MHQSKSAEARAASAATPAIGTTHAITSSSRISSGAARTATWATASCAWRQASTSAAAMFSPERRMMFFFRSTK